MILAPLEMTVPAADGLILKGTLTYPRRSSGTGFPLAVVAHGMTIYFDRGDELLQFLDQSLARQ